MKTIYRICHDPFVNYALPQVFATTDTRTLCPLCGMLSLPEWSPHPLLSWVRGSDRIGDFALGGQGLLARREVAETLCASFGQLVMRPVEVIADPEAQQLAQEHGQQIVAWPYLGPELVEIVFLREVEFDRQRSTVDCSPRCPVCGIVVCNPIHVAEIMPGTWTSPGALSITQRFPGRGVYVKQSDLGDAHFFTIRNIHGALMCTDRAKRFIENRAWSNILFLEQGESCDE